MRRKREREERREKRESDWSMNIKGQRRKKTGKVGREEEGKLNEETKAGKWEEKRTKGDK